MQKGDISTGLMGMAKNAHNCHEKSLSSVNVYSNKLEEESISQKQNFSGDILVSCSTKLSLRQNQVTNYRIGACIIKHVKKMFTRAMLWIRIL